mgnify:CR=1 FL=1
MPRTLKELLAPVLGEKASRAVGAFDIIGDIAIIRIPDELMDSAGVIGEALMKLNRNVKSVWAQVGPVEGDYRTRDLVHIAGERRSETIYRENGCLFKLDVTKVFFTPRLSQERKRIAELVRDGEVIFNMFAGVGTYSIVIAKKKDATVHSSEINPYAYQYMLENIALNRLRGRVIPYLGDAAEVAGKLEGSVDRVLMPLPEKALQFFEHAVRTIRGRGTVHVYLHVRYEKGESARDAIERARALIPHGEVVFYRAVREVGPRLVQAVYDVVITR